MTYVDAERRRLRHLARVAGITLSFALLASANVMACDDNNRPGTPYPTRVEAVSGGVAFHFTNTQHEGGRYYDIQITDGAGHVIRDISGRDFTPTLLPYGQEVTDTEGSLPYGTNLCFAVRGRDGPGKSGCVSHEWAKPVCLTTPTADVNTICSNYANTAIRQEVQLTGMQQVGECNFKTNPARWDQNPAHHYDACIGWRAQGKTLDVNETNERDRILKTCVPLGKTASSTPAPQKPAQACTDVTVQISNDICTNGDGSRMTLIQAQTAVGCGQTEDAATMAAKQAFFREAGSPCLDDGNGPPLAGCCTYKKTVLSKSGCSCPLQVQSLKRYNACGGARPVGTAPFCCPAGSVYSNGACHSLRAAARPETAPGPVALAPSQIDRSFMAGIDLPGADYRNEALNDDTATTCKSMCATDAKCLSWTWVKPGVQNAKAMCWLKNAVPSSHPNPNATSGVKTGGPILADEPHATPPAAAPQIKPVRPTGRPETAPAPIAAAPAQADRSFMIGTDLPGSDYRNAALNDDNAATCKTMCATDAKCLAWTWVKPGVQNAKAMCWLKNAVPSSQPNPNVTSGIKVTSEVIH